MLISKPLKTDRSLVSQQDLNYPTSGVKTTTRYNLVVGVPVSGIKPFLLVSGGVPFNINGKYRYYVIGSNMVPGLFLDQYTGEIYGTPLATNIDQFGHVYRIISQKSAIIQIRVEVCDQENHRARNVSADTKYATIQFYITWPEIKILPSITNLVKNLGTNVSFNIFLDGNLNTTVSGGGSSEQTYAEAGFIYSFDVDSMRNQFDAYVYPTIYDSISKTTFGDLSINPSTGLVTGSLNGVVFSNQLTGKIYFNVEDKYGNIGKTAILFTWNLLSLSITQSFSAPKEINLLLDNELLDSEICTTISGGLTPYTFTIDNALYSDFSLYNKSQLPAYSIFIQSPTGERRTRYIDKSSNSYAPIKITDSSTGGLNGGPQVYEISNVIINVHNQLLPISPDVIVERSVGDVISNYNPFNVSNTDANNLYNGYPTFIYSSSSNFPSAISSTGVVTSHAVIQSDLPTISGTPKDVTYTLTDASSHFIKCKYSFYLYPALTPTYPSTLVYPIKEGISSTISIGSTSGGVPISNIHNYRYALTSFKIKNFTDPTMVSGDITGATDYSIDIIDSGTDTALSYISTPYYGGTFICNALPPQGGNNSVMSQIFNINTTDKLSGDSNYAAAHTKVSPNFQVHVYSEMRCNNEITANIPLVNLYVAVNDTIDTSKYPFTPITGGYGSRVYSLSGQTNGFSISSTTGNIIAGATYAVVGDYLMTIKCTDSLSNSVSRQYKTYVYNTLSIVSNTTGTIYAAGAQYYKIVNGTILTYSPVIVTGGSGSFWYSFDAGGFISSKTLDGVTYILNQTTGEIVSTSSNYIYQTYNIPIYVADTKTNKTGSAYFNLWTTLV